MPLDGGTDRCVTKEEMSQFVICLLADTQEIISREKCEACENGRYSAAAIEKDWGQRFVAMTMTTVTTMAACLD